MTIWLVLDTSEHEVLFCERRQLDQLIQMRKDIGKDKDDQRGCHDHLAQSNASNNDRTA